MNGTIPKVKIDQSLEGNAGFFRQRPEVGHSILIDTHRYRLLQVLHVSVFMPFHIRKIVMVSHRLCLKYACSSALSAFLAEKIRTTVSP